MQTLDFFFVIHRSCKILKKALQFTIVKPTKSRKKKNNNNNNDNTGTESCSEYKTLTRPRNNHLQNFFIDPRVLCVDAAISYLAVLVPKKEKKECFLNFSSHRQDNCCFLIYSHKEETGAHMVRYGTHPNVPVLFEVL